MDFKSRYNILITMNPCKSLVSELEFYSRKQECSKVLAFEELDKQLIKLEKNTTPDNQDFIKDVFLTIIGNMDYRLNDSWDSDAQPLEIFMMNTIIPTLSGLNNVIETGKWKEMEEKLKTPEGFQDSLDFSELWKHSLVNSKNLEKLSEEIEEEYDEFLLNYAEIMAAENESQQTKSKSRGR